MNGFGSVEYALENKWESAKSYFIVDGVPSENHVCYHSLWNNITGRKLTVFHPFPINAPINYINWVLNSELFGLNFITKDAVEGLEKGFEVNTSNTWRDVMASLIALRYPFELGVEKFLWNYTREVEGFTEEESLMISIIFSKSNTLLCKSMFPANHVPISKETPITSYNRESIYPTSTSVSGRYIFKHYSRLLEVLPKDTNNFYTYEYKNRDLDSGVWDDIREMFKKEREVV